MFFPQGSYTCGKCKPGFVGDGFIGCRPGDLCASGKHDCHLNATCITLGSERFYCQVGRQIFQRRFFAKCCLEIIDFRIIYNAQYVGKRLILHKQCIPPLNIYMIFTKIITIEEETT